MAGLTLVIIVASFLQWMTLRDTITHSDRTFEMGNRAYIIAKDGLIHPTQRTGEKGVILEGTGIKDGDSPALEAVVVNAGHTPARNVVMTVYIEVRNDFVPDNPTYPSIPQSQTRGVTVMAPDATLSSGGGYFLNPTKLDAVKHGHSILTIYGFVTYLDIFDESRKSTFCYFYAWEFDDLRTCPHHNNFD